VHGWIAEIDRLMSAGPWQKVRAYVRALPIDATRKKQVCAALREIWVASGR